MRRRLSGLWMVISRPPCVSELQLLPLHFASCIATDGKGWSLRLQGFANGAGWLVRINCGTVFNLLRYQTKLPPQNYLSRQS